MNYKLYVTLCDQPLTIFLANGFYSQSTTPTPLHRHGYTELHAVCGGKIDYSIGQERYVLEKGDFLVIPPHVQHSCDTVSDDALHISFFFDRTVTSAVNGHLPESLADRMMDEARRAAGENNYFAFTGYVSLMLSGVFGDAVVRAKEMRDDAFIIDSYIETRYASSPSLSELSEELKLSEKQAARLVKSYTGYSFTDMITQKRMKIAHILLDTTDMTLKEISEYVGYSSYSGFYKAFRKAGEMKEE